MKIANVVPFSSRAFFSEAIYLGPISTEQYFVPSSAEWKHFIQLIQVTDVPEQGQQKSVNLRRFTRKSFRWWTEDLGKIFLKISRRKNWPAKYMVWWFELFLSSFKKMRRRRGEVSAAINTVDIWSCNLNILLWRTQGYNHHPIHAKKTFSQN